MLVRFTLRSAALAVDKGQSRKRRHQLDGTCNCHRGKLGLKQQKKKVLGKARNSLKPSTDPPNEGN